MMVGGQTSSAPLRIGKNGRLGIHDANVFKDPDAVAEVLKSKCPISLAPIQTSIRLQITPDDLQRIRGTNSGEFLYRHTRLWSWFWRHIVGMEGGPVFDALPILALIQPDLVSSEKRYAVLNKKGALIAETTPMANGRAVRFGTALRPLAGQLLRRRM